MIRIVLENLLLFFLPTLAYAGYRFLIASTSGKKAPTVSDAPFLLLFAAGALAVVASIAIFASKSGGKPGEAYVPPVVRDGKIVPGHRLDPSGEKKPLEDGRGASGG